MSDFNWPTSEARGRGYNKGGEVKKPMDPEQPRKPKGGADRDPDSNLVFFGKTEDEWKVMSEKAKRRLKLEYEKTKSKIEKGAYKRRTKKIDKLQKKNEEYRKKNPEG